jgi:hypothetical protein
MYNFAGTPANSLGDGGAAFNNLLSYQSAPDFASKYQISPTTSSFADFSTMPQSIGAQNPFEAFASSNMSLPSIGAGMESTTTNPYAGMENALAGIEDSNTRGMLQYLLERDKFANSDERRKKELEEWEGFEKRRAWDAAKMQSLMSVPKIITDIGKTAAQFAYNKPRLDILARTPELMADIYRQGLAAEPVNTRFFK